MYYHTYCGETLSALGLGTMRLPVIDGDDERIDVKKTEEMIDYAIAHGITYFDTSWVYHGGTSERIIANCLRKYPRDSYYIADKFPGFNLDNIDKVEEIFEEQLKRTGLEYFDFYLLHNVLESDIDAYLDPAHGIIPYLKKQKELGRIKHLGFSSHGSPETLRRFLQAQAQNMEFCQLQVNWVDWHYQNAEEKIEILREFNIPLWVMEPLRGGKLCRLDKNDVAKLQALRPTESLPGWGFRFIQSIDITGVILTGTTSLQQLAENIAIFDEVKPVSAREKETLFEIANRISAGVPCTECKYCIPTCPQNLNIPRIIRIYNEDVLSDGYRITPVLLQSLTSEGQPTCCISCGKCTEVCPQGIAIPEVMADMSKRIPPSP